MRASFLAAGLLALGLAARPARTHAQTTPAKADDFFGSTKVWTIHLKLTAAAWDQMQPSRGPNFGFPGGKPIPPGGKPVPLGGKPPAPAKGPGKGGFGFDFTWVRGTVELGDRVYRDVGVRFKGNSTYMSSASTLKRPFKFDFNRFVEGQTPHGLTVVSLGNNAFDPTQLREALSYEVYRVAGVPAPRTAFVKLYVTVEGKHDRAYAGLYTLIEAVNKRFLKRAFGSAGGLLLKPERIQGLPYFGADWARYEERYQPKTDAQRKAKRRLIAFTKLVNQGSDAAFRKEIGSFLDVDGFLRYLAASALMVNLDSFLGMGHNYYLYLDPKTDRFRFIPWDLNMSMGGFAMAGGADKQAEVSVLKPTLGPNQLIDRLLAIEDVNKAYRAYLEKMVATVFRPETLNPMIDAMTRATREAIALERKQAGKDPKGGFGGAMMLFLKTPDLKPFVARRVESVALQLAGKSAGFTPRLNFPGFGPKGPRGAPGFGLVNVLAPEILKAADTNRDGKVALDEWLDATGRLFKECDPRDTGAVTEKQLADGIGRLLPPPPGFGPPPKGPKGKDGGPPVFFFGPGPRIARSLMKEADRGQAGKVTRAQALEAAKRLFREADGNKDGRLDDKEVGVALGRLLPPRPFGGPPGFGPPPQPMPEASPPPNTSKKGQDQ